MSLSAAMNIGRTALGASQAAIQVIGNNIANASTPGYSRQLVSLAPMAGQQTGNANMGLGVSLGGVRRQVDQALQGRLWSSLGQEGAANERLGALTTLEASLNELTGHDLSSQLSDFFSAWSERANLTESSAVVVQKGAALGAFMRSMRADLVRQREALDAKLSDYARRADELVRGIADLNRQIPPAESGGAMANELRDQRDILITELATLMDVTAVEQGDGTMNVLVGSTPVVLGANVGPIRLERLTQGGTLRVRVLVGEDQREIGVNSGKIGALLASRATAVESTIRSLDQVATALIFEVNRLHSTGSGKPGLDQITSSLSLPVEDRTRAFNDPANATLADLPFAPRNGGFFVEVLDKATNTTRRTRVGVDLDGINNAGVRGNENDSTPEGIRAALNSVPGLNATFDAAGRLRITADEGFEFSFADDSSGVLAVMGVNTYFQGSTARDIDVRPALIDQPQRLMVGRGSGGGFSQNATALEIVALRDRALDVLGGRSLTARWQDEVQNFAGATASAQSNAIASTIVRESLSAQHAAISGVSLDEEAINLTTFQRQYQGAARLVAVADELLRELINLI